MKTMTMYNFFDKYRHIGLIDRWNHYNSNMRGEHISFNQEERIEENAGSDYDFYNNPQNRNSDGYNF